MYPNRSVRRYWATEIWGNFVLIAALAQLDRIDEAKMAADEARARRPEFSISFVHRFSAINEPAILKPFIDGLRRAGIPEE